MIVLINPNLIAQRNDLFTTGVVYMPIGLAYFAAALKKARYNFKVIDAFGEDPQKVKIEEGFLIRGLSIEEIIKRIPQDARIIFIYASNITYYLALTNILKAIKTRFPQAQVVIMENTQAVTSYSLKEVQEDLYNKGADFLLTGEPEMRGLALIESLCGNGGLEDIDGLGRKIGSSIHHRYPEKRIENLDELAFPAWEYFPLDNYWSLKYSHGPFETKKYLPLLTSRGCVYGCRFCLMPYFSAYKWSSRTAKSVVDEMEYSQKCYGVSEFHIEDVNPTVSDERTREICRLILDRSLKVIWKLASGTKIETIKNEETLELMAKAGCDYISISPETGSGKVLELMNKPFNLTHAVNMVKKMNSLKIFSQVCFVLGFPGEDRSDMDATEKLVKDMTRAGADEIAVFIITPVPGSELFGEFKGYYNFSQLNFSPDWRKDYVFLNSERLKLYATFLFNKTFFHFPRIIAQVFRFFMRSFKTKMEMVPYRAFKMCLLLWKGAR